MSKRHKILLVGGSAGSLDVLMKVLPELSRDLAFIVVLVLHRKNTDDSTLEELIAMKSTLPVREVEDKVELVPGNVYIAPSDYHLLFEKNGLLSLDASEKVNYSRPSIDVIFESAADVYGEMAIAVLLSGSNADGTDGLKAISEAGGVTIVQSPESAGMSFMPKSALDAVKIDYVLEPEEMAAFLNRI
ncbi:chemotaxis protein CheB [Flavobacterium sp.]|uniref:chemotaxis protein CheB n=1 Tax=Flavobacterium sp. TaxID=239 RepID=UPI0025C54F6F|nr:chemotaxis protein CheB [Flavobacterium sp.]